MAEVTGMTPDKINQEITNVKSYVNGGLSEKADKTQVASDLSKKADKTQVASDLSKKADTTQVTSDLSKKADITYVDSLSPLKSFVGSGYPEGRVSAPIGSIYTDTAATNGAIRWIKTSGTGNTGWLVEYGDTGWRNITSLWSPAPTQGIMSIRRTHAGVDIHFDYVNFPESKSTVDLPRSWWPGPTLNMEIKRGSTTVGILSASSTGRMTYTKTSDSTPTDILSIPYRYPVSWPETGVGTPL